MLLNKGEIHVNWIKGTIAGGLVLLMAACSAGQENTDTRDLKLEAGQLTKLVIANRNGEIQITGADTDTVQVNAYVKSKGISMDKLKLELRAEKENAYLDALFGSQFLANGSGSVDLKITLPRRMSLELDSHKDGAVRISSLSSEVKADNINGDIEITDTLGPVTLKNRDGDLTMQRIGSDIHIDNINGHIETNEIQGSAIIKVGYGSLILDQVTGNAVISQNGSGKVTIGAVKGTVTQNK
jgi:DUF4097 and DUF4098 domain-containing protein YvlB